METSGLSASDVLALSNGNGFGDGNAMMWFVLLILLGGNNWNGRGNGFPVPPNVATSTDVQNSQINNMLQNLSLATERNNYETAQLVNGQTNTLLQQNNTNLINALQGFNNVNMNLMNQTNVLSSKLDQLGYQMDQCCCSIKTQMLQDRLSDAQTIIATQAGQINNANQSQYILSQLGRFVAWTPSGTQATTQG